MLPRLVVHKHALFHSDWRDAELFVARVCRVQKVVSVSDESSAAVGIPGVLAEQVVGFVPLD